MLLLHFPLHGVSAQGGVILLARHTKLEADLVYCLTASWFLAVLGHKVLTEADHCQGRVNTPGVLIQVIILENNCQPLSSEGSVL